MASKSAVLLILLSITEFIIVSWSTLWPLRSELAVLGRASGWWRLYSFALGNLDVLSLALIRTCTAVVAVQSCPAAQQASDGGRTPLVPEASSNHDMVRHALSGLYGVYASFLLVKAAAVAVTAPADLWPDPTARPVEVGLVYLYGSIVTSLIATLLGSWLARRWVADREAAWEAAVDADDEEGGGGGSATDEQSSSLRAPLLRGNPSGSAVAPAGGKGGGTRGQGGGVKSRRAAAKSQQRTISALLRLTIPDLPLMAVAFSAGIVAALGSAMLPYLTGQIIDFASIEPDRSKFRHTLVQLLLVAACTGIFTGTRGGLFTIVITRLNVRLRRTLFHSLLQQEVGFFDTTKTGEITSRLSADTSTVADQIGLNMNVMLRSATSASMVLFFMFAASWRLTVVTFILIPVVLAINQVYGKIYARMSKRVQEELAGANGVAEEVLSSMTTVKAHAAQDSAEAAYLAKLNGFYRLQLFEAAMYSVYAVLNTFLPNLVAAVVLFYGGSLVLGGQMSPGSLVSFMLYQQSLSGSFQLMGDVFTALTAAVGAAEKVVELMRRVPAVPPAGGLVLPTLSGRVELERVVLHYPARPHVRVLDGLSLVAQPGEVVALVGASGGGKSSIVKLLQRFYLPSEGRVLIDGHEIGAFDPKWLRRQVALVSQEPVLYGRSICRNIVFGLEQEDGCAAAPTQEDVEEAARMANAHEFITTFPEGYDTGCGEKGVTLSGGQKQRIAIARALVRRPRVLLLDEATSALDADSEAVVQEALDRVMSGRTVVVVAHRLSTIQGAHRIYVVGRGTVQETGTHDDLLAAGGVYAQLVRRQLTRPGSQANLLHGSASTASLLGQGTDDILPGSSSTPYRSD